MNRYASIRECPEYVGIETARGWEQMEKTRDCYGLRDTTVIIGEDGKSVSLTAWEPVLRLRICWRQEISEPVKVLGDHWERGYGDLEWRGVVPERVLPWYVLVSDAADVHCWGVKTGGNAFCSFRFEAKRLTLEIDVRCGGEGVMLNGKSLLAAEIVEFFSSERPYLAAKMFCQRLCAQPRMPEGPVYGGNDWYSAYGNNSSALILEHSRMIADWAGDNAVRPYMVVDDGWEICHSGLPGYTGGPWGMSNRNFPEGMASLADKMKKIGVRPGLWFRPLLNAGKVPASWKLQRPDGERYLDPSVDGVLELVSEDMKRFSDWGFELVKHDYSTYDIFGCWGMNMGSELTCDGWHFSREDLTTAQIIKQFYQALRDAGKGLTIIGCNTVGHLAAGIFDIQRCGDDTSGRKWEVTRKMGPNTLAFRMPQHETFFAVDGDCVGLTRNVPWEKNRQWLDLLAQSGTPLFVSVEAAAIGKEQERALKEAFKHAGSFQIPGEPLDWCWNTCPSTWLLNGQKVEFDW